MALQVCPKMFATKLVAKIYGRGKIKKQQTQKFLFHFVSKRNINDTNSTEKSLE
jgi:hypothetical protein